MCSAGSHLLLAGKFKFVTLVPKPVKEGRTVGELLPLWVDYGAEEAVLLQQLLRRTEELLPSAKGGGTAAIHLKRGGAVTIHQGKEDLLPSAREAVMWLPSI